MHTDTIRTLDVLYERYYMMQKPTVDGLSVFNGTQFEQIWKPELEWKYWSKARGEWMYPWPEEKKSIGIQPCNSPSDVYTLVKSESHDLIKKPPHYYVKVQIPGRVVDNEAEIDCIAVLKATGLVKHHFAASAFAYIWRAWKKGSTISDLEKAVEFLNNEIAYLKEKAGAESK